jgi:hypothetical protein
MTEQEFVDAVRSMPEPMPVSYRLYHDDQGGLLFYSMDDVPGSWIEIDQAFYTRSPHRVRVLDGQVHELEWRQSVKLQPGQIGTPCHPKDVTIVHDHSDAQRWAITAYEQN